MEIGEDLCKDEALGRSYNHGQGRITDAAIPGRAVFWARNLQKCTVYIKHLGAVIFCRRPSFWLTLALIMVMLSVCVHQSV